MDQDQLARFKRYARGVLAGTIDCHCGGALEFQHLLWEAIHNGDSRFPNYYPVDDKWKIESFKLSNEEIADLRQLSIDADAWGGGWNLMDLGAWIDLHQKWQNSREPVEEALKRMNALPVPDLDLLD